MISFLEDAGAVFKGFDHQTDTYFNVRHGRLKIRDGKIENNLIWYDRSNTKDSRISEVLLFKSKNMGTLKEILAASFGILAVVDKKRRIYFIENVKFHLDEVKGLGKFVEVEAQGLLGEEKRLHHQCNYYRQQLLVRQEDIIGGSYCDMITTDYDK